VPAKSVFQLDAIVGMSKRNCFAAIAEMRRRASVNTLWMVMSPLSRAGPACSSVAIYASVSSIAVCTGATRSVIRKRRTLRIAQGLLMSLRTVRVGRRHCRRSATRRERRARTRFQAVRGHVARYFHAAINASRSATRAIAETADRTSSSNADAVAHLQTHSATRARMKRLSVCASVERC